MKRSWILLSTLALAATVAAQTRPIQVQPVQPAPQATQVSPAVDAAARTAQDEAPMQAIETVESLRAANKKLRDANRALKAQNTALADRITQMTTRGGSQVRAWCPAETLSRSTAGDENDCGAAGYTCEKVSGLCRTTCQTSDHCAANHTCDPNTHACVYTGDGVPGSDG